MEGGGKVFRGWRSIQLPPVDCRGAAKPAELGKPPFYLQLRYNITTSTAEFFLVPGHTKGTPKTRPQYSLTTFLLTYQLVPPYREATVEEKGEPVRARAIRKFGRVQFVLHVQVLHSTQHNRGAKNSVGTGARLRLLFPGAAFFAVVDTRSSSCNCRCYRCPAAQFPRPSRSFQHAAQEPHVGHGQRVLGNLKETEAGNENEIHSQL